MKTADVGIWLVEGRWKTAINFTNKLGSQGKLAGAFAKLLHEMWGEDLPFVSPTDFRVSFCSPSARFRALVLIVFDRDQYANSSRNITVQTNMTHRNFLVS